jgi:hypothetical protein
MNLVDINNFLIIHFVQDDRKIGFAIASINPGRASLGLEMILCQEED